jgi:hypothetical protein
MNMVNFAKILVEGTGHNCGLDRRDFELEIEKRAEAIRAPGESRQQAFTKYATTTDDGRLLFKASLKAPPRQAVQDLAPPKKPDLTPAARELDELAREMARSKKYSYEQAFSRLYTDPERKALVERYNREQAELKTRVANQRFPLRDAEEESRTKDWARGRGRFE